MSAINAAKNELTSEILKRELAFILNTITGQEINHFYSRLVVEIIDERELLVMLNGQSGCQRRSFSRIELQYSLDLFSKAYLQSIADGLAGDKKLSVHTIWFKQHPEQEEQYQAFKARFLAETADKPNSWD